VLRLIPSLIILLQVKFLNVKSDIDVNIFCLFVSNPSICVPTLVVPYNNLLDAVIVVPVIFPEPIVPVVILLVDVNFSCFVFKLVSILYIFVSTLVVPYNELLDAIIVGAVIVVLVLPVMFPKLIVPVVILIFEPNAACLLFKVELKLVIIVS
jgi:hypothetical protein